MSSDVFSTLRRVRYDDYATIMSVSAVGYDYVLTFSREVDYIWSKRWTWGSTIYVLVRYAGLCWVITGAFGGSSFIPGPVKVSTAVFLVTEWVFPVVLAAADLMMILRVYAIWGRSKRILSILSSIYIVQTAISVIMVAIYDRPNTYLSVTVNRVEDLSYCIIARDVPLSFYTCILMIPRFTLGVLLFALSVGQALKESMDTYRATGQWQPNRYIKLFVKDGTLYFFVKLSYNIIAIVQQAIQADSTIVQFVNLVSTAIMYIVLPRFILSVRELYHRNIRGGAYGIDSGFGVLSQTVTAGHSATMSAIAFADGALGKDRIVDGTTENTEAIRLDVFGEGARRVSKEGQAV